MYRSQCSRIQFLKELPHFSWTVKCIHIEQTTANRSFVRSFVGYGISSEVLWNAVGWSRCNDCAGESGWGFVVERQPWLQWLDNGKCYRCSRIRWKMVYSPKQTNFNDKYSFYPIFPENHCMKLLHFPEKSLKFVFPFRPWSSLKSDSVYQKVILTTCKIKTNNIFCAQSIN